MGNSFLGKGLGDLPPDVPAAEHYWAGRCPVPGATSRPYCGPVSRALELLSPPEALRASPHCKQIAPMNFVKVD